MAGAKGLKLGVLSFAALLLAVFANAAMPGETGVVGLALITVFAIMVGFVNVTSKESLLFLTAMIAITVVGGLGTLITAVTDIVSLPVFLVDTAIGLFVAFGITTIVVAARVVLSIAKNK